MLLIGNKASENHGCCFNFSDIEIIHEAGETDKILKGLNIKEIPFYINHGIQYFKKGKETVVLYDASRITGLQKILKLNSNTEHTAKSVNFLTNLAFYAARIKFRKIKSSVWEDYLYKYLYYKNECKLRIDESFKGEYTSMYNRFLFLSSADNVTLPSPYQYLEYGEYDRLSVLSIVSKEASGIPIYDGIILGTKHSLISRRDFESLSSIKQIEAVMEKLYCDTITEYILPKLERNENIEDISSKYFSMALMNLATNVTYPEFFRDFIISNYLVLVSEYTTDYISLANDIYKYEIISKK